MLERKSRARALQLVLLEPLLQRAPERRAQAQPVLRLPQLPEPLHARRAQPLRGSGGDAHLPRCAALRRRQSAHCPRPRGRQPWPAPGGGLRLLLQKGPAVRVVQAPAGLPVGVHWWARPLAAAAAQSSAHLAWEPAGCAFRQPPSSGKDHATCRDGCPGLGRPSMSASSSRQCLRCACRRYQPCISRLSSCSSGKRSPSTATRPVTISVGLAR